MAYKLQITSTVINYEETLTVGKVNVLGDLVPGAIVKMPDLLFVLHHVGRLPSLFVFHSDIVLDRLKILPMLKVKAEKIDEQKRS